MGQKEKKSKKNTILLEKNIFLKIFVVCLTFFVLGCPGTRKYVPGFFLSWDKVTAGQGNFTGRPVPDCPGTS